MIATLFKYCKIVCIMNKVLILIEELSEEIEVNKLRTVVDGSDNRRVVKVQVCQLISFIVQVHQTIMP